MITPRATRVRAAAAVTISLLTLAGGAGALKASERSGTAGATYVALGDSYSAGEGLGPFEKGTDVHKGTGRNQCHRSVNYAYSVVKPSVVLPQVTSRAFFACSGAKTADMRSTPPQTGDGRQVGQPQQTDTVGSATQYISLSVGGNDVGFGDLGLGCVQALISHLKVVRFSSKSCEDQIAASSSKLASTKSTLVDLYGDLLARAKDAKVVVLGYPRVLPASYKGAPVLKGSPFCILDHYHNPPPVTVDIGMPVDQAKKLDAFTRKLNDTIKDAIRLARLAHPSQQSQLRYADSYASSTPRNCKGRTAHATVTAAQLTLGRGVSGPRLRDKLKKLWIASSTLHPTKDGQKLFADLVQRAFLTTPKPPVQPSKWMRLPGGVLSYTDDAVLTTGSVLSSQPDDDVVWAVGTRSGKPVAIDYSLGTPRDASIRVPGQLLTEPSPGHPLGLAVLTLDVAPSEDDSFDPYGAFSVFDTATGQRLTTSARFDPDSVSGDLVGYIDGKVRIAGDDFATVDAAGRVTHSPLPGKQGDDFTSGPFVEGPPVNGRVLVAGYDEDPNWEPSGEPDEEPDECPMMYVVDVATQATLSKTPCLHDHFNSNYSDFYFDGSVFAKPGTSTFFSAATGQPVSAAGQLGDDTFVSGSSSAIFLNPGARSDLTIVQNHGYTYFVSTTSWQTLFATTPDEPLTGYGIADDDVWIDTYHWEGTDYDGERLVIDGHDGRVLARDWDVLPVAGGSGWTLARTNGVCCDRTYLLRSSAPLVSALSSVPNS